MAGSDRPWERVIDITGNEKGGNGNLFFYLNNINRDRVVHKYHDAMERADYVIEQFQSDMPGLVDECVEKTSWDWGDQPWIQASFGSQPTYGAWMIDEWKTPEAGRIHLAGDFTTLKSGWVEGAIESGIRAARNIDPAVRHVFEDEEK